MRSLCFAVLLTLPLGSLAADPGKGKVYKWVDEKGVVHYTDEPPSDNARPAELPPLQTFKGTPPDLGAATSQPGAKPTAPATVQIDIVTPAADETFRGAERTIPVAVVVTPPLKDDQRLVYLLDGAPQSAPTTHTSHAFTGVDRGTHTVAAAVVDGAEQEIARSNDVTVHVMPPSATPRSRTAAPTAPGVPRKPPPKPAK